MPTFDSVTEEDASVVRCPRINLADTSKLPKQGPPSPAWPSRSRKQQLEGLLFSPRTFCTSPDDFARAVGARREASEPNVSAHADRASEQQLPALPATPGHLAVPRLNLPHSMPKSSSLDDVSYRKDKSLHVLPTDLSRLRRPDASVFSNDSAAANSTGTPSKQAEMQPGIGSNSGKPVIKSAQHGAFDSVAASPKWLPSSSVSSPQQTSRLAQQPSSWQLSSPAVTARSSMSPSSNKFAAKSWQQVLSTASAHEQWVVHKHTAHGRMSETGDEEEWGELLVRVPKQASTFVGELMQQLPQALAGSMHTHAALQLQDESAAQLTVVMGGIPSGRGQTLLLADWLHEQVSACTSPDSTEPGMQSSWELDSSRTTSGANDQRSRAPYIDAAANAGNVAKQQCGNLSSVSHGLTVSTSAAIAKYGKDSVRDQRRQEQHKLVQEPDLSPPHCTKTAACSPRARTGHARAGMPHLPSSACQQTLPSWQGLLPQECENLGLDSWAEDMIKGHPDQSKRALGMLGGGYGLLVHQVAMHCFERGALMAGIWNMYTALMDAELQSLEEHVKELMTGDLSTGGSLSSKQLQRMVTALDLASDKSEEINALEAELLQVKSKALLYETVSRELEEEALQRESEVDKQLKSLAAAAAVAERKRVEELKSKDQQVAELQAELLEQSNMTSELASKLEMVTTDVNGLGRFMSEQLVPATPVVEQHTQPGSRFVCVGLDALSAADELVEGVSLDLQQVIAKMKQAAHMKYTPGAKFGTENKAVLHTYIQQQSLKAAAEVAAGGVVQDAQDYVAAESAALQNKKAKDKSMDELTAQGSSEPRSITVTIKVEEPIFLTLDVGKADDAEISDLRVQLSNLHRQLEYSHAQLADNSGVLRTAQQQLAHTHDALSLERQKTKDLTREMTAISKSPLAGTSNTADVGFDSEESSQRSRGWADRDGPGNGIGHRATFASTGHSGSGLERAAAVAQAGGRDALSSMSHPGLRRMRTSSNLAMLTQEFRSSSPLPLGKVNQLQEALAMHPDVKPRSMEWCLKLIDSLFKSKRLKDIECDKSNIPRALFMDHVFAHLLMTYGAKNMVTEFAACLMVSAKRHRAVDLRIEVFERFATAEWDLRILNGFLTADQLLAEPSRVPCCDYPPTHAPVRYASPWVCIHKCIFVADMVLGKRSAAASKGFAARLVALAGPAEEQEVQRYYVDPQNSTDREADSAALAKILLKSEFKKMSAIQFKQALCMELLRCEGILKEALPSIIKDFDLDDSGSICQQELADAMAMFEGGGGGGGPTRDPNVLKKECDKVWKEALQLSMAESSQASLERNHGDISSSSSLHEVDIKAAARACRNSEIPRRFIRLHYTPPMPTDESTEAEADMAKMMFLIVKRQWQQHQQQLTALFAVCDHKQNYLNDQAARFLEEGNHQRKVQLFFTIILTLLEHQLLTVKQKCTPSALAADPKIDVEAMFRRITNAVKVLYGQKCLLQDDFFAKEPQGASPIALGKAVRCRQDQLTVYNAVHAQVEQYAAKMLRQNFAKGLQRWREQAEVAVQRSNLKAAH